MVTAEAQECRSGQIIRSSPKVSEDQPLQVSECPRFAQYSDRLVGVEDEYHSGLPAVGGWKGKLYFRGILPEGFLVDIPPESQRIKDIKDKNGYTESPPSHYQGELVHGLTGLETVIEVTAVEPWGDVEKNRMTRTPSELLYDELRKLSAAIGFRNPYSPLLAKLPEPDPYFAQPLSLLTAA